MRHKEIERAKALQVRAPDRLARYRKFAAHLDELARKHGTRDSVTDWRTCRYETPANQGMHAGRWQDVEDTDKFARPAERAFYVDAVPLGWRVVGNASDVLRREGYWRRADECEWYCDAHQTETVIAAVLQLPARNGECRYVPAIYYSDCDGITCWPLDHDSDAKECALKAAGYAERIAEEMREESEKENMRQDIGDELDAIAECRRKHSAFAAERSCAHHAAMRLALEERMAQLRDDVADSIKTIREKREALGD